MKFGKKDIDVFFNIEKGIFCREVTSDDFGNGGSRDFTTKESFLNRIDQENNSEIASYFLNELNKHALSSIKIDITLPVITNNFKELKVELTEQLKQFDLIVDVDSIDVAKKMATSINKVSKEIDTLRKNEVAKLSVPVKEFELEAKSLTTLCQESRKKLLSQVAVFEEKTLKELVVLLEKELEDTYTKYGVSDEFRVVQVNDLAIKSNKTKTSIAKKAKDTIDERVLETKRFQEKIDTRLLTLETICLKAGLIVPLTRQNIDHFLKDGDDDVYLQKLVSLIQNEISRLELANELKREQETTKAIAIETKKESPKENPLNVSTPHVEIKEQQAPKSQYSHFKNIDEFKRPSTGKRTYTVTATFEVEVDEKIAPKLEQMLIEKFVKTGFKQVPTVTVHETEVRHAA